MQIAGPDRLTTNKFLYAMLGYCSDAACPANPAVYQLCCFTEVIFRTIFECHWLLLFTDNLIS